MEPGDLVGDWQLERELGRGGTGWVYAATHVVIGKRAAIKVLRREYSAQPDLRARFVREARAVGKVAHPSVVDVFGYGVTEDGYAYLAMELVAGETLGARIARSGSDGPRSSAERCGVSIDRERIPLTEACELLIAIADALEAAHAAGIAHRDLKPDNIILSNGRVRLLDFGIARVLGEPQYTTPGQLIGTPLYMSPEQARGERGDTRSDLYALGAIAFELFTGRPPFIGRTTFDVIAQHATTEPPRPSQLAALPPGTDALVLALLDKDPANRPALPVVKRQLAALPDGDDDAASPGPARPGRAASRGDAECQTTREMLACVRTSHWRLAALLVAMAGFVAAYWL